MDISSRLYEQRIEQLQALVASHIEAGSLDEASTSVIEPMIESWLAEEKARLELAHGQRLAGIYRDLDAAEAVLAQCEEEVRRTGGLRDEAAADLEGARERLVGLPRYDSRVQHADQPAPAGPDSDSAAA